jgi:hypothetical protein
MFTVGVYLAVPSALQLKECRRTFSSIVTNISLYEYPYENTNRLQNFYSFEDPLEGPRKKFCDSLALATFQGPRNFFLLQLLLPDTTELALNRFKPNDSRNDGEMLGGQIFLSLSV